MRDPNRIYEIVDLLALVWENHPDWRFGQLVFNLLGSGPQDVFFVEDDEWLKLLKEHYNDIIR